MPPRTALRLALGLPLLLCLLALLGAEAAHAQAFGGLAGATGGTLDTIVDRFATVRRFEAVLQTYAVQLFAALAGIEVVLAIGWRIVNNADVADLIGAALQQLIVLGFMFWLLINGPDFLREIVDSFALAGNAASTAAGGTANLSPSNIISAGINTAKAIWGGMSAYNPVLSLLLAIAGLIVLPVFAAMTAMVIAVLVESFFVASVGVLMLGFGGSAYTRNLAAAQFHLAIGVGVKRLVLQLIVGLTEIMMQDLATTAGTAATDLSTIALLVSVPIVLLFLAWYLPQRAEMMVMGHYHGGYGLGHVAGVVGKAAAAAGAALAGSGAVATAGIRLASEQIEARSATGQAPPQSRLGYAAAVAGGAMRAIGQEAAKDVGNRLTGHYAANHGHMTWRMADSMGRQATASKAYRQAQQGNRPQIGANRSTNP